MTKSELNKKTSEFLVTVTADVKEWKKAQEDAFNHLAKELQIKGFRKGSVPTDLAKKHISKADIFAHAITNGKVIDKLGQEAHKELTDDIMVLGQATYKVEKVEEGALEVTYIYPVYPDIKLGDYKKLGVKLEVEKVDPKVVEAEMDKVTASKTTLETKDGAIAKGDIAIFDFEGFVDEKAFEGGKAEKYQLEIGSGQFIPGFEDQMIGVKAGEEKDVKVTFPKEYHSEELKGKDAVFKIKLHEVKVKKTPELTDELVKELGIKEVETVAAFKTYLEGLFEEQARQQGRAKFQREAFDKLLENADFAIPSALIVNEMRNIQAQFEQQLQQQNIKLDQYMQMTGMDQTKMQSQFKQQAEARLRDALVFAEIAKAEKIELTDEDYAKEYEKLAKVYNQSVDGVKGLISKAQMQIPMTNDRVLDKLAEYNK